MLDLHQLGSFAGGLGLFLLGMWLMTEGLKLAAGHALERILGTWTRTRLRGLLAGILVTALVQSSSAVTVAAIGFVNAGLLTFSQTVWVIFGSNVGTTMTGWLVALVGFKLRIEAFALPLIGLGMVLRLTGEDTRRGALGTAAAGFGALFLGIDILRASFAGLGENLDLAGIAGEGPAALGAHVLAGILLTVLMQSSSAALAVALTAAGGGLIPLAAAAAMVIGANIGTTVTALLAAIGATASARRAAAAHIVFNLLTGAVALTMMPLLLAIINWLRTLLELEDAPATTLALFHTAFNVLGVLLMWPLAGRLTQLLQARFRASEEDEARPRHLDDTVLAVPALALDALGLELKRLGGIALRMARTALGRDIAAARALTRDQAVVDRLAIAIGEFTSRLGRVSMTGDSAARLPELLRVARYYDALAELAVDLARAREQAAGDAPHDVVETLAGFRSSADELLALADTAAETFSLQRCETAFAGFPERYQQLKGELLRAGASGRVSVVAMEALLREASLARRAVEQAVKAARHLHAFGRPPAEATPPAP